MVDIEKEIKKEEKKFEKFFKNKTNIWMIVSVALAVILVLSLVFPLSISKNNAGQKVIDFANSQGATVTVSNVTSKGLLYEVTISYQGQSIPFYVTKDGKYLGQMSEIAPTKKASSSSSSSGDVPKTDKPTLDLYVFSYCPYGIQSEKAVSPVYDLLKNKADINIVYIGAMHGEYEKTESLRQLCVLKNYGKDKFWQYLNQFNANTAIGNCKGSDSCLSPLLNNIYSTLSIDSSKINSCMASDAASLYSTDGKQASSLGISGSPTWVINGVESQVGRSPEQVKQAICSAFTNAPSECSQTLSTSQASVSFGSGSSSSSSAASCG